MKEEQFFKEKQATNIFIQLLQKYLPFWPLFALTIPISMSVAYVYYRAEVPIYVASAKVLLKDPNKGSGDSKVLDALNIFSEKKIVENEILVLRSSGLMQEVVSSLDLYTTVFNEGKVRLEELYGDNTPVSFVAVEKEGKYTFGKYPFKMDWINKKININGEEVNFTGKVLLGNTWYRPIVNMTYNKNLSGKNYFLVTNSVGSAAAAIIRDLKASPISSSSTVLEIKLQTPLPDKGRDILYRLFEVYNKDGIDDKNQIASKTLNFIEDRLNYVIHQLDSVEENIEAYKNRESLYSVGTQGELYLTEVRELDNKKGEVNLQLEILQDTRDYVLSKGRRPGTVPSLSLLTDVTLSGLLSDLYKAEYDLENASRVTGENSEPVVQAKAKISRLKSDILENIVTIKNNLVTVKNNISKKLALNNRLLQTVPQKERGLLEISRQQIIKNNIYSYLLQKREETAISSASTSADLRVIETPTVIGPVTPIAKNFYLTGFIIGLLIAVFMVLMKEQFKSKVLFRDDIEDKTSIPFVGEIAQSNSKTPIIIQEGKRTVIAEQLRSLRTNLAYMGLNDRQKTLLITSSISSEGKSFLAINLAISFTLTGKKVALMEMDLRKPKLSKMMNVPRDPGISNYVVGKADFKQIIRPTSIPNLFIIPAGAIPPNPTELIGKPAFGQMMEYIKNEFDYVFIDTAPIGPVIDAQLLKDYADVTLYVIRHDRTPKIFLKMINEFNQQKKFNNMCIVFNGVKKRGINLGHLGNGYGYGYGYGYSYGYGYAIEDKENSFPSWKLLWEKGKQIVKG